MSSQSVLTASPYAEETAIVFSLVLGAILLGVSFARRGEPRSHVERWEASLTHSREVALLLIILAGALLMRTLWWNRAINTPFWFSETTPLYVAKMLHEGQFWQLWIQDFNRYQVTWTHESALVLPVSVVFQILLGPSFHLPLLVGAFYGVAAVFLAWATGRVSHSKVFGLLFAALVSVSPLQLTWSRLGGFYIASVAHVLLVLWCSYVAGRRRSYTLTIIAALGAWGSLYQYYAARVAIPLAFAALAAGLRDSRAPLSRRLAMMAALPLTLILIYALARPTGLSATFWPAYGGYVGNKGERNLYDFVHQNATLVGAQVRWTLRRYFLFDRTMWEPAGPVFRWGTQFGGLCLIPVALLGCLGLLHTLWAFKREWLWLVLAASGLALPVLSLTSARRFLVFDLAWCALASHGLILLMRSRLCRGLSLPVVQGLMAAFLVGLAGWSFASVVVLNGVLAERHGQPIPFGESGFGDGNTCLRCLRAGYEWQKEIADNRFVVLFDTDQDREGPGSPGGLRLYGKLAALAAGRPGHFIDFYAVMNNVDWQPPQDGSAFYTPPTDFASYLSQRVEDASPVMVVWHFERPTQWERWFAERLRAAGGEMREFPTPLSSGPGIQVRTAWSEWARARGVLWDLARDERRDDVACPLLKELATARYDFNPLHISGSDARGTDELPRWVVGGWATVRYNGFTFNTELPVGSLTERVDGAAAERLHTLTRRGEYRVYDTSSEALVERHVAFATQQGLNCGARVGSHWWVVDPTSGELFTTDPDGGWVPRGQWVGITRGWNDELVLASADQRLVILDPRKRAMIAAFPAAVWPIRRVHAGECSPVVAGKGWYGTFNHLTSVLTVYEKRGRKVGARKLNRFLGLENDRIMSIAAQGSYLAIGYDDVVKTVGLSFSPMCLDAHHPVPEAPGDR